MSSATSEYGQLIEIDTGSRVKAVTFTANCEYLVSGGVGGVQVWRVKDGEQVATMQVEGGVECVAVSKNGKYIGAGYWNEVSVWGTESYEQVFTDKKTWAAIWDVDFSPDATRLVSADGNGGTATVWDILACEKVQTLDHGGSVRAARYSSHGQIATATCESVRVWDDGRLLVDVLVELRPWHGLFWFNEHIFIKSGDGKVKQIDATTGTTISQWPVPNDSDSCISMPHHGKFMAYSTADNVTFWNISNHTQLGLIPTRCRSLIAFSPDDDCLAIVAQEQKILIHDRSLLKQPEIRIDSAALDAWKHDQLTDAEGLLTAAIPNTSMDTVHHLLASRALVRARLGQSDTALVDAEESIKMELSIIGHVAKCVALIVMGEKDRGLRVCDIAFHHFHSNHTTLLLLIKAVVLFMAGEHDDAISRIDDLISVAYFDTALYVVQAHMHLLRGSLHMENGKYELAIQSFEDARVKLGNCIHSPPLIISLISGWKFNHLAIEIQQKSCEALLAARCVKEAGESVLSMVGQITCMAEPYKSWSSDFIRRCLSTPGNNANTSGETTCHNCATLREGSHPMTPLVREWAKSELKSGSWKDALTTSAGFILPRCIVYQVMCECLEATARVIDAVECFHQMRDEVAPDIGGEQADWIQEFTSRCCEKLEDLGDSSMDTTKYDNAILQYTAVLSLDPAADVLVKRSKAHVAKVEWEGALNDANEAIRVDPHSPWGYEQRHAALHGKGEYDDAILAFKTMLEKMSQSSDPGIRERFSHYVTPERTKDTIHTTIGDVIRDSPLVLINTSSGRLCDKSERAAAFASMPGFTKLVSSMTTHIDQASIKEEVGEFYRYAMFSHKWEEDEPLYEEVTKIIVYDLEASPTRDKLRVFCKIVREAGLNWAWSDTCCIDKRDHLILQEALISMFKWYENAAMTIIFLLGVDRLAPPGAMMKSIWNMRAWTFQEYHASKVVRFYTRDWTPYLGLTLHNHKDSPEIISEMEEATGISAQALMALRPGLDDVREKLRLASMRQTTRIEDAAYSLLGIFSLSLPVVYGEGDKALGRLLAQLLASSGDTSILAWTGVSGSFNTCLPSSIIVFSQPLTSHIPQVIPDSEMETIIAKLRSSLHNQTSVAELYDRVQELPVPMMSERRIKLPCLAFKLGRVSLSSQNASGYTFHAQTNALGVVEIRSKENLSQCRSLYLIHPWIDFLLDRQPVGSITTAAMSSMTGEQRSFTNPISSAPKTQAAWSVHQPSGEQSTISNLDVLSLYPPSTVSPVEKQMRIFRFMARLGQPFGALLVTQTRRNMEEYRRVAAESLIRVQVKDMSPAIVDRLVDSVRIVDVL